MSVEIPSDLVGLEQANAELDKLMAGDSQADSPAAAATTDQSATVVPPAQPGQRAAQRGEKDVKSSEISSQAKPGSDTPTTADKKDDKSDKATPDQAASDAGKTLSRYAKAAQRKEKSWQELNQEKEALRQDREKFERDRSEFQTSRQQQEKQYSPEQYEQAANKFEQEGKFELAELARKRATDLRQNPPPSPQQQDQARAQQQAQRQEADKHQAAMKEWWGKAAVDFPSVAKPGTPEAVALKSFLQAEPEAVRSPKGMYYAARLVSAEAAVARVPEMEKELGALRARVKELEAVSAPSPKGIPSKLGPGPGQGESVDDLERLAAEIGPLR